jgi:hypothetical protein
MTKHRRQVQRRRKTYAARVSKPITPEQGMQFIHGGIFLGDLGGHFVSWLFDVKPETRESIRLAGRISGGLYGAGVAVQKFEARAQYMNQHFGHLKSIPAISPARLTPWT